MKTKIKIKRTTKFQDKIILDAELLEGEKILKNDIFINNEIELKIKSIGMIESKLDNIYPIIVDVTPHEKFNELIELIFEKR